MKKNHSYLKNVLREIRSSFGRFFSIFAIVALGTGFFAGLVATAPDMLDSVDAYYDRSHMSDLEILSTLGLTDADVEVISEIDGIAEVSPVYSMDVLMNFPANRTRAARLHSLPKEDGTWLNRVTLLDGKMPQNHNECVVAKLKNIDDIPEIGSTITINSPSDTDDMLSGRSFTITGIVDSAYYFSIERERTTLGSGSINMVLYLPESAFTMDCYTQICATVDGGADRNAFDDDYKERINEIVEKVEGIADAQCKLRFEELTAEPRQELADGWEEFYAKKMDAEQLLADAKADLDAAKAELDNGYAQLDETAEQMQNAGYPEALITQSLADAKAELDAGLAQYETGLADYENGKTESEEKLRDAEKKLLDAQKELDEAETGEWYVKTREDNISFASFEGNAMKIAAIAVVFPVFFFMVAVLVALTTMTRMVEEQRVQIGTLKALGYSNAAIMGKYVMYAGAATLLGSALGLGFGMQFFPMVLWNAYGIMYHLPPLLTPFRINYALIAFLGALFCTMLATVAACFHSLRECAASLMLPKAPKAGKRVLLEYISPIWKRMKFTHKVTVRNLLRYKKRFFMTIVGIAGCTALLVTGFGLSDSINEILDKQYAQLNHYDLLILCKNAKSAQTEELQTLLSDMKKVLRVHQENCDISANGEKLDAALFVPQEMEIFPEFLTLRTRKSGSPLTLEDDTVILTEKAAETLGISVGDTLELISDNKSVFLTIGGITENYVNTYVYMSPVQFEKIYGKQPDFRMILTQFTEDTQGSEFAEKILECDGITTISLVEETKTSFHNMVNSINYIIIVLIFSAGLLAFVVLYNLMNINITERERELATIKVLGFYEGEVGAYVFRETLILSLLGTVVGLVLGIFLHGFVVRTAEVDMAMFGREIYPSSFAYAAVLTMVFSLIVCLAMFPKLRKINMVESLKSVE